MTIMEREEILRHLKARSKGDEDAAERELKEVEQIAEAIRLMKRAQETTRRRIEPLFKRRSYRIY